MEGGGWTIQLVVSLWQSGWGVGVGGGSDLKDSSNTVIGSMN